MSGSVQYLLVARSGSAVAGGGAAAPRIRRWISANSSPDGSTRARDYVVELGGLKQDDGFTSKVVLAWATRLGSCQVDPTFGSRFHEIQSADERGRRLAEAFGLLAIKHLENEIKDLKVTASLNSKHPGLIFLVASGRKGMQTVSAKYTVRLRWR